MAHFKDLDFRGKTVLIRADLNVPVRNGVVSDNSRIQASLPTINKVLDSGGAVVLMSHLGRPQKDLLPDGKINFDKYSMKYVATELEEISGRSVYLAGDVGGEESVQLSKKLQPGEILLLENTRFEDGESKGTAQLGKNLARLADFYVNDAFGTAHRAHASTTTVADYFSADCKAFGLLMEKELAEARKIIDRPTPPYTVIMGGAKVSDKILLLEKLIEKADHILIGGGMAYTFILARGGIIGQSISEPDKVDYVNKILSKAKEHQTSIHLPEDTLAATEFSASAKSRAFESRHIPDDYMGLDIGPKTIKNFCEVILKSKTIFWNGPMGVFEYPSFASGTIEIAKAIGEATSTGAYSLIGGGDSVAAVNKFNLGDQMSYLSTGGGAMLTLLEGSPLPAVEAIEANKAY